MQSNTTLMSPTIPENTLEARAALIKQIHDLEDDYLFGLISQDEYFTARMGLIKDY